MQCILCVPQIICEILEIQAMKTCDFLNLKIYSQIILFSVTMNCFESKISLQNK